MDGQNSTKFCIYITIDMIYPLSVLQTELCSWTYLCPLIVLCWGYGQVLWQFKFLQVTRTTIKSHEFKIWPDQTMVCGVSCSWTSEKIFYLHVLENYPKYFYDILTRRWAIVALWATCFIWKLPFLQPWNILPYIARTCLRNVGIHYTDWRLIQKSSCQ